MVEVGIGILIMRYFQVPLTKVNGPQRVRKILVGERRGSTAAGTWEVPGGKMEYGETLRVAALRELREECGSELKIKSVKLGDREDYNLTVGVNEGISYLGILVLAEWVSGEAENVEPEKSKGWEWLTLDELMGKKVAPWLDIDAVVRDRKVLDL